MRCQLQVRYINTTFLLLVLSQFYFEPILGHHFDHLLHSEEQQNHLNIARLHFGVVLHQLFGELLNLVGG